LTAEGLFDPARKRPLPRYPRRIAIVASPTGAAVHDLIQVIGRRWRCAELLIAATRVQGEGAADEVVAALDLANRTAGIDLIVVARGGGSLEDLWTFNEEAVVRAIAGSRRPVISAIGHEIDVTLADLAADCRALTPSAAGELAVPDSREVALHLDRLADRIRLAGQAQLDEARAQLARLAERAQLALRHGLLQRHHRLARLAASLEALSPLAVLSRGFSLTFHQDGTSLVRAADQVHPGQLILTQLATGRILSRVETTSPSDPHP
jgi:exodeoxyribonuclease VII large subunit